MLKNLNITSLRQFYGIKLKPLLSNPGKLIQKCFRKLIQIWSVKYYFSTKYFVLDEFSSKTV